MAEIIFSTSNSFNERPSPIPTLHHKAVAVLEDVNSRLVALADGSPDRRTIGATVVGLTVANGRYCCFWAGDSRAYHVRDGSIEQLTHDHSLVQDLVDAGMLTASEAQSHPNANVITRAVGARDFLTVDTVSGEARSGDIFVLSSDGLTRQIGQEELLSHLWGIEIEESAESLLDLALARGGADNISLIVVHVL